MNPLMNPVGSNAEGKFNCINATVITHKETLILIKSKRFFFCLNPLDIRAFAVFMKKRQPRRISVPTWLPFSFFYSPTIYRWTYGLSLDLWAIVGLYRIAANTFSHARFYKVDNTVNIIFVLFYPVVDKESRINQNCGNSSATFCF